MFEEWEIVRDLKLLGYHELYNDLENKQMIIVQDYLPCNLLQYISNQNKYKVNHNKRKSLSMRNMYPQRPIKHHNHSRRPSLKSEITYPHLTEKEAKEISISVLCKIKKMHKYGFIHCDIKPENIMKLTSLNNGGNKKKKARHTRTNSMALQNRIHSGPSLNDDWRIIDFGLRARYNVNKGYCMNSWRGTIGWTAPELIPNNGCNNRISPELDVWCMGLCILYMVIGENPFELTIKECKENKLYSLESGKKYWYYSKLLDFNKNKKWNHYLIFLHKKNKISLNLLDLLLNHMLVFDVKKRSSVKQILKHQWFRDILKVQKINQQKKFLISK